MVVVATTGTRKRCCGETRVDSRTFVKLNFYNVLLRFSARVYTRDWMLLASLTLLNHISASTAWL